MLERLPSYYAPPKDGRDDHPRRRHENGGVGADALPPGCVDDAGRWDYIAPSAPELERWFERSLMNPDGRLDHSAFGTVNRPERDWSWGWNASEVIALSRRGWHDLAGLIGPMVYEISNAEVGHTREPGMENDVEGTDVDVDAFLRGEPESMRAFREVAAHGQSLTLVVDAFMTGNEDASTYYRRGVGIAAAVLAIQAQNIAVSVLLRECYSPHTSRSKERDFGKAVKDNNAVMGAWLHRPGDVLDVSRLLVWLAHPAWLRMVFYQCEGLLLGAHNGSHGEDPELVPGTLVIPRSTAALFASAKSTEAFIKQAVEAAL